MATAEEDEAQHLTVAVRLRPLSKGEEKKRIAKVVRSTGNRVVVSHGAGRGQPDRNYAYDKVFSPSVCGAPPPRARALARGGAAPARPTRGPAGTRRRSTSSTRSRRRSSTRC